MSLKKTPLHALHLAHGAKMVDFAGWEMPIEYQGIMQEHRQVRAAAGMFDVSHMGEILVSGPQAEEMLQRLVTSDLGPLKDRQISYTFMCAEDGGVIDDLLVYKFSTEKYLLVVNAANTEKDFAWLNEHRLPQTEVRDLSSDYALIALQGPLAESILQPLTDNDLKSIRLFRFEPQGTVAGKAALISRTGYTGEDGFELYLRPEDAPAVWEALLAAGPSQIAPVGLGARDTLRFETKLPLYGQELGPDISPLEADLSAFVNLDKEFFIGQEALKEQTKTGLKRRQVEFVMEGRGVPRAGYPVEKDGQNIGHVTSGYHAPSLEKNIGLALVKADSVQVGDTIDIVVRSRTIPARVDTGLFYTPAYRRKKKK